MHSDLDPASNVSWMKEFDHLRLPNYSTVFAPDGEDAPALTVGASIKAVILAVMALASIIGNSGTLINIIKDSRKGVGRGSIYTLLIQLAVADLLVSVWCLLGEAIWTYTVEWRGGEILCKIFKFAQVFSLYLSTSTMVLIGFDRLLAIRRPINHRSCSRPICSAWMVSIVLASPQLAIFRVLEGPFRQPFYQCVTYGFYTEEWQEQLYSIFSLLTMFAIPLVALIGCYACIFHTIAREKERALLSRPSAAAAVKDRSSDCQAVAVNTNSSGYRQHYRHKSSSRSSRSPNLAWNGNVMQSADQFDPRRNIFQRAKVKSLKISILIVSAFVVCWAPYYFMMITFIFLKPDQQLGEGLQSAIFFFGMSNSLINPLIYGAFHLYRWPKGDGKCCTLVARNRTRGSFSATLSMDETSTRRHAPKKKHRRHLIGRRTRIPLLDVDLHVPPPSRQFAAQRIMMDFSSYSHSSASDHLLPSHTISLQQRAESKCPTSNVTITTTTAGL